MESADAEGPRPTVGGADAPATLISASCTTSWFDWIHGELWLCPNGLLRRSVGLLATVRRSVDWRRVPTVDPTHRPRRTFDDDEIAHILAADRRNRWIEFDEISHATLKRGVADHSLHVELRDGRREKFLWLSADGGYEILEEALGRALEGRFSALDRPIG